MGRSTPTEPGCALLADRHAAATEGLRNMLSAMFAAVITVADATSLMTVAESMEPTLAVIDLSLVQSGDFDWLKRFRARCPRCRIVLIRSHDNPSVRGQAFEAGADAVVDKQAIAGELLATIDAILAASEDPRDD